MTFRLYSRTLGHSSHVQVSRGFRESLVALDALSGEYQLDIEPLPEEPPRAGAAAQSCVWTGPLVYFETMRQAGRHRRRYVMVAPNSNRIPPNILRALEAEATDLLAPSSWAQGVLQELTDKLPVHLVPHGVHPEMVVHRHEQGIIVDAYGSGTFAVGHFSTSERQRKGTSELVQAWGLLRARKAIPESSVLVLVLDLLAKNQLILEYDGEVPDGVSLVDRMHLSARNMNLLLHRFHLICQPSRGEAFGMIPLESLASGTPIAATACTGHSEYLSQGHPGAVVIDHGAYGSIDDFEGAVAPTVSPDAIAAALERAYKDWSALKQQAVDNAPAIQERWAWGTVLRPWIEQVNKEAT